MIKNILTQGVHLEDRYIPDYSELESTIQALRALGYTISMTQGVYDLLHPGHARYLNDAKSYGDVLVVALDSDEYTRLRKAHDNERRPVVPFDERLELLVNLRSVSVVTKRDVDQHKDDPYAVIKVVRPDVLVMSSSTKDITDEDHQALKEFCGEVVVLDARATVSTTSRLREMLMDGGAAMAHFLLEKIQDYFAQGGRQFKLPEKKND
jgi:D-beta-D-heptose 7-phosphate kinase/D-beta-D-heptose 1-phosphate adenosyltransferase